MATKVIKNNQQKSSGLATKRPLIPKI